MSQVLVVGAGPVGLTMAAELARHGVRCRIVDKLATRSPYCRAVGVTPRTLEVWEHMGDGEQPGLQHEELTFDVVEPTTRSHK